METDVATPVQPSYAIAPSVLHRQVDEQMVLLDIQSEKYFGLNEVGADMVQRLTSQPWDEALASLERDYEVDRDVLRKDVDVLVDSLLAAGLLVRNGAAG
jgi:hypothetical protein